MDRYSAEPCMHDIPWYCIHKDGVRMCRVGANHKQRVWTAELQVGQFLQAHVEAMSMSWT